MRDFPTAKLKKERKEKEKKRLRGGIRNYNLSLASRIERSATDQRKRKN